MTFAPGHYSPKRLLGLLIAFIALVGISYAVSQLGRTDVRSFDSPIVRERALAKEVLKLREDSSKRLELASTLAELSMLHEDFSFLRCCRYSEVCLHKQNAQREVREAVKLIDPADRTSQAYFDTRRALCYALNEKGQQGWRLLVPLLDGNWSDLDKAQIYEDLASFNRGTVGLSSEDCAMKALALRVKSAGPHSLEVADSLVSVGSIVPARKSLPQALRRQLQIPEIVLVPGDEIGNYNKTRLLYFERAAQIQEEILGDYSLQLARTLSGMSEKDQLRAVQIFEQRVGPTCLDVQFGYARLAREAKDPIKAQEYMRRFELLQGLQMVGNDPVKQAYLRWKSGLSEKQRNDRQDAVTRVVQAFGAKMPDFQKMGVGSGAVGHPFDTKKLGMQGFDRLYAGCTTGLDSELSFDLLYLDGWGSKRSFRMRLPTWGRDANKFEVVAPGRFRFRQEGTQEQGFEEMEYKWTGKTFVLVDGKPGPHDAAVVQAAIDDAVDGIGYYGIRGHHAASTEVVKTALQRADEAALALYKKGDARSAAERMKAMFELTSDLVMEASTGASIDAVDCDCKDDVQKWTRAWSYKGPRFSIDLTAADWDPWLQNYEKYRSAQGALN